MNIKNNLHVSKVDSERASKTCGNYYYLVTSHGASYKAFNKKESFELWMNERKLSLVKQLPTSKDEFGYSAINGEYKRKLHMSCDDFYALKPKAIHDTRTLDNADYVRCFITEENGEVVENILNCNIKEREVFDRESSLALFG